MFLLGKTSEVQLEPRNVRSWVKSGSRQTGVKADETAFSGDIITSKSPGAKI
jgi:hypothetical protein